MTYDDAARGAEGARCDWPRRLGSDAAQRARAWFELVPPEVARKTDDLLDMVDAMRADQVIYPAQERILNALATTAPSDVRVVILGQDPYHEPGQAMGLSFSVPRGQRLPPSLRNIYKELVADVGCPMPASGDLTSWAEQGVLLMNTILTVREHAAGSHAKIGWQTLTDAVVRACLRLPQPVVFLTWGRHAIDLVEGAREDVARAIDAPVAATLATKFQIRSTHPSPLSANRAAGSVPAFLGSRPFSQANELLRAHGAVEVNWASVCDGAASD